jgi:hypothetical protein
MNKNITHYTSVLIPNAIVLCIAQVYSCLEESFWQL